MDIKNEVLIRVYVVLVALVLFGILLFAQTVRISVFQGEKWRERGESLYVERLTVEAERGNIISEDGSLMATSLPFFDIRFDPNSSAMSEEDFYQNVDSLAYCLATYVNNSRTVGAMREFLVAERNRKAQYVLIKRNATYVEKEMMSRFPLFNKGKYRGGFIVESKPKREHPFNELAFRTIGYIRDGHKPVGLEGFFNDVLAGEEGKKLMFKAPGETYIPMEDLTEIEPKRGDDIVTTIDINLQDITHDALLRGLKYHNAKHGTAILMDVKTGAVKAMANIGKADGGYFEIYNYGVGSATEPGSTFKLATIMALLEDGHIDLEDSLDIEKGKHLFYEEEMLDSSPESFMTDTTTIRRAFEISSNVGIAKLVQQYYGDKKGGDEKFIKKLKDFRLHLPVNIEIKGEAAPFIKTPYSKEDEWSGITLPWMAIGYELTITPLQLLTLYNTVANDGQMMKPYLVSEIRHFDQAVEKFKPTVIKRKIASKKTISKAKELLLGVVENGTAHNLKSDKYKFAGKTGTAQINYRKFNQNKNIKYQASFAGYFPAEKPAYSCIVVVTEPLEHGFYGGEVAGPIFREIADKCIETRYELHPALNEYKKPVLAKNKLPDFDAGKREDFELVFNYLDMEVEKNTESDWTIIRAETDTLALENRFISEDVVPNVVDMGLRDAMYILENRKLKVVVSGSGRVRKQSIIPGTPLVGQTIRLTLN
ncbi:MAG: cell division protein FtsI (penicillin-binding protein 3) [Saprospiraceae bacterium]|jgi:cell division protein FtsI (penicillin-binding protein 3)